MADIRDLRIGDRVLDERTDFPFIVVGLLQDCVQAIPEVDDYEGDVWEFNPKELSLYNRQCRLLEWEKDDDGDDGYTLYLSNIMIHRYVMLTYFIRFIDGDYELSGEYILNSDYLEFHLGTYKSLSDAKDAAQKDFEQEVADILSHIL